MRLDAYKYGQLVKVSNEAVADTGFPLVEFVAENIGRAVGRITDTQYVSGDGSGDPNGIITAASVGATTGGSLIALGGGAATAATGNLDALIALQHSVVSSYRQNAAFVMNDQTAGTVRKVKDGGNGTIGAYIWTASTTLDPVTGNRMPDTIFGDPVYTDVNFGTNGSAVKPVAYGDWSAYYIRDSGAFTIERSNERYFDTDEVGFRGLLRTDSDLIDTNAIKVLQQAV
jgi:HK97 family phage major capsid protein